MTRPIAVAITGGIGAGKSEALAAFERHGAAVVSSDEIVHRLLGEDADVKGQIVRRFGKDVVDDNGNIDRASVGAIVFRNREELAWLEDLLHPLVSTAYLRWRDLLATAPEPPRLCVTEVPLLYETGGERLFDAVVAITASAEIRKTRAVPEDMTLREQRLIADDEKARRADFAYVNEGSAGELEAFVAEVIDALTS